MIPRAYQARKKVTRCAEEILWSGTRHQRAANLHVGQESRRSASQARIRQRHHCNDGNDSSFSCDSKLGTDLVLSAYLRLKQSRPDSSTPAGGRRVCSTRWKYAYHEYLQVRGTDSAVGVLLSRDDACCQSQRQQ